VTAADFPAIAEQARRSSSMQANPASLDVDALTAILDAAL
jgi:hypothetical protein